MVPASKPPASIPGPADFVTQSARGTRGFFRLARTPSGFWWWIDPLDRAVWLRGVEGVNRQGRVSGTAVGPTGAPGGTADEGVEFVQHAAISIQRWHAPYLGAWAAPEFLALGHAVIGQLDMIRAGPTLRWQDMALPDVFDPRWSAAVDERASAGCAPLAARQEILGWLTDETLGWAQPPQDGAPIKRPTLLQLCLALEPTAAAWHAAWEWVLAAHGSFESAMKAWQLEVPNRASLRLATHAEQAITTQGYLADHHRFTREFARRYHQTVSAAVRRHAPSHLVLGARLDATVGPSVLAEATAPHVDVIAWQAPTPTRDANPDMGPVAPTAQPYILLDFNWTPTIPSSAGHSLPGFASTPAPDPNEDWPPSLVRLEAGVAALRASAEDPRCTGCFWSPWIDPADAPTPPGSRGLIHADGTEAYENSEPLAWVFSRVEQWRAAAVQP